MPTPADVLTRCETGLLFKNPDKCTPMPTQNPTDEVRLRAPAAIGLTVYTSRQEAHEKGGPRLDDLGGGRELVLR